MAAEQPQKKGTRTPTRAEAEAARMARLHPVLSRKEQKKANRDAERAQRLRALAATEATPARQLVRDVVDSRWTLTEYVLPLMVTVMVVTFGFASNFRVQQITSGIMFVLFALWLVNIFVMHRTVRREAAQRGINVKQRGLTMYMVNRMMTLRAMRRPDPRVKRGEAF